MRFRATLLAIFLAACSQFEGTDDRAAVQPDGGSSPGQDGDVVTGEPGVGIAIVPITTRSFVAQGQSVEIPIHITRAVGENDAVHVIGSELPSGVSIRAIDIPTDGTDGKLTVAVSATAVQGSVDLSISATADSGVKAKGILPLFVRGAPGALDTTFAPDPLLLTVTSSTSATLTAFADGSMVIAGETGKSIARLVRVDAEGKNLASNDNGLGRFVAALPDGRLLNFSATTFGRYSDKLVRDPSFNGTGAVVNAFTNVQQVEATSGAVQVLGETALGLELSRWSADGARDTGFVGCKVSLPGYSNGYGRRSFATPPGGNVRIIISTNFEGTQRVSLFGCASDGSAEAPQDVPVPGVPEGPPSIVTDGIGGFLVAASTFDSNSTTTFLHLDVAGAPNGQPFTNGLNGFDIVFAAQPDKSIVVANHTGRTPNALLALRRFSPDGTEDSTFIHGETSALTGQVPSGVVIQKDGRIVVLTFSGGAMGLLRYWG